MSLIGAENPRLSEGTGVSSMFSKTKLCAALSSTSTPRSTFPPPASESGRSRPSQPTRPIASGMTIGSLLGWPGVGGTVWAISNR